MEQHHTIRVIEKLLALDEHLANFTADVRVNCIPESGNGWDEPRERAFFEFSGVMQIDGPHIRPAALARWADHWVDNNQDEIFSDVQEGRPF